MVRLYVNDKEVEAEAASTLLDAIVRAGFRVPTLCYLRGIFSEATCRVCIVELSGGRLVPSCSYPVAEGLRVYTDSERVLKYRRAIIEMMLAAHRIRCQSCSMKGGYCQLLKLSKEYGVEGIPVCSECPLHEGECLLNLGVVCLGPITVAGCDALCTREGSPCIGCRGPVASEDVLGEGVRTYARYGVRADDVVGLSELFWSSTPSVQVLGKLFASTGGSVGRERQDRPQG